MDRFDEEMEFHREARIADLIARGVPAAEASRQASVEFGSVARYREEGRAALGYRLWDELRGDLRFAARGLRKSPGFAVAAVAILGLAIGANGLFFTLYAHYLLKPLPVRGADRHVELRPRTATAGSAGGFTKAEVDALSQARTMEGLYSTGTFQVLMLAPEQRHGMASTVSSNYFTLFAGRPALGRVLSAQDEHAPVTVLSHIGWQRLLKADPEPLGKALRVRNMVFTVVGVMAPEFTGTELVVPDFWVSAAIRPMLQDGPSGEQRFRLSGLLAQDVNFEQAQQELSAIAGRFARPEKEAIARIELQSRTGFLPSNPEINIAALLVFMAFVMVLLIACANLANLYLSRAAARLHEIGTRLSLGASRWRIVRQLLTESSLVALLGAAAGLLLASATLGPAQDYLFAFAAELDMSMLRVTLDWRVALYAAGLGVVAGVVFGLLPALEVTARASTKSTVAARVRPRRMRDLLIGGQVAASLVLLILAGVLIRNIQRLDSVSPGFDLDHTIDLRAERPTAELVRAVARQPGVASVTGVQQVPLYGRTPPLAGKVEGATSLFSYNYVDHRYFETFGLAVEGRGFREFETESGAHVAVISRATARRVWPAGAPIGRSISFEDGVYEVVGVAPDIVNSWLFEGPDPMMVYFPAAVGGTRIQSLVVRLNGVVAPALGALRKSCAAVENAMGCLPAQLREAAAMGRFPFQMAAAIAGLLGLLALVLTAVGLYGVTRYHVVQRQREIGVLMALGASPRRVMRRILTESLWCVFGGTAVGLPICLGLSRLAASSVFQIQTFDPWAYLSVPVLLGVIALLACLGPARRAALVDPMVALREE